MFFVKKEYGKFSKKSYGSFILAGDIGGTNTNLGIFGIKDKFPALLLSFHFKSKEIKGLSQPIGEVLEYAKNNGNTKITKACFAVAGVLSNKKDYVKVTNAKWDVSKSALLRKTKLKNIILINDFEAVGYGINMLKQKDIVAIKKAGKIPKAPVVVVGAGTGLGKTTLIYDEHCKSYEPLPSEAGHGDFPAQTQIEFGLVNFIKKQRKTRQSISYEDVLSGKGLRNIYSFLRKSGKFKETKITNLIDKSENQPELMSKYRKADKTCAAVFEIFKNAYAGFARNLALDALAFGGVYIAGGIAPRNMGIFDGKFVKAFEQNHKHADVLKKIPVCLILNYNAGLLGAGFAGFKMLNKPY